MIQIITFIFLAVASSLSMHEFHLSKTEVNYKSDQKALQVSVHLFIDDLEEGIKSFDDEKLYLFENNESIKSDSLINFYIQKYLKITLDGSVVELEYLGKEVSDDLAGVWSYLELENVEPFEAISISNSLLTSTFDDQKNIINVKMNSKSKAFYILDQNDNFKVINI
jgi:hypothetical protein